jgi:hypothetical protein
LCAERTRPLELLVTAFGFTIVFEDRIMVSWACFGCGMLGGFISVQQRLKTFGRADLELMSRLLFEIVLIPVYGGLFALALCVGFLSQIVTGALFPQLAVAPVHFPATADLQAFFGQSYPASDGDLAKPMFWRLVVEFFERFVPQIISRNPLDGDDGASKDSGDAG